MKIAQVCPYDIDRAGGVQRHILDLSAALRELGHEVQMIAPGPAPERQTRADPDTFYVGRQRSIAFSGTHFEISHADRPERARLQAHLDAAGYDLLHLHTPWVPLLPLQVLRRSHARVVATFHDTPPSNLRGYLLGRLFTLLARALRDRVGHAIAVSESPARHLAALRAGHFSVLPPCVDLQRFAALPPAPPSSRGEPFTVLYLGRLEPRKSPLDLLQACARLQREGLPVRLRIAGAGPLRAALERGAAAAGLVDCQLLGAVAEADKPALYADADLFCAPSRYGESFGIVLVEAMAAGRPVVAAANSGYRTVLSGPGARFLYAPGDVPALAARIAALARDPALRAAHAAWGRAQALAYDARALAPRFVEIYRQVLAAPARHCPERAA